MRLLEPVSKLFKLRVTNTDAAMAPGLSLTGLLEFRPNCGEKVCDRLLLALDDEITEIPLLGFPCTCSLQMDSLADFGSVVANNQVISKELSMTNHGSAPGAFQVLYSGHVSVRLSPSNGVIAPGVTHWLKVDLHTDQPRRVQEEALVKLQNGADVVLTIQAEVVDQCLELYDHLGAPLSCIQLGPTYFGTSQVRQLVLRNNGPQACDWVVLLQEHAPGTELGVDLHSSTDAALRDKSWTGGADLVDAVCVLRCMPSEGRLEPNGKTTLSVQFSPVCKSRKVHQELVPVVDGDERSSQSNPASRQDYALFLQFETLESRHGFTPRNGASCVELAVTGSGLPVALVPSPSSSFTFQPCAVGQHADLLCVLQNRCSLLPVAFRFRKTANFNALPPSGEIGPGQSLNVVLSFNPHQVGCFQVQQLLEVLGPVACGEGGDLRLRKFHSVRLWLSAVGCSETSRSQLKFNPGITPALTNGTGPCSRVHSSDLVRCAAELPVAVLSAGKTRLHRHRRGKSPKTEGAELVAFPNDRAASIRPASPDTQYRTIFTGVERYRYVDPDYAFTEEEQRQRQEHKERYLAYFGILHQARMLRAKKRSQAMAEDEVDIGIGPDPTLLPPTLTLQDLEADVKTAPPGSAGPQAFGGTRSVTRQVTEGINAVPSTSQEMADCSRTLTAQQLFQVVVGPSLVDFGEVCAQSWCEHSLELANHLSEYVWVQLELDCPELQRSSPLSHVLPPLSRVTLPLLFQSGTQGCFHRTVSYTVNQQHPGQVLVQAQVVPVALELSTSQVVLGPAPSLLAQSGYRGMVTLSNRRNHPAEFTWRPIVTKQGIAFSVRPATGTVEAFRDLDCEVVWHPSFCSPLEGHFDLCVHQGNTLRLHCLAKVGSTSVQLAERHLVFESVPLNIPTVRRVTLHNTGPNHAYYQVLDVYPLPGMVISPADGLVPVGGQTELQVTFNPSAVIKFDTRVEIALRSMKSLELRLGGAVEPPLVEIDVKSLKFHAAHAGSVHTVPFCLKNRSPAPARVQIDLSEHTDFTVRLPGHSAGSAAEQEAGMFVTTLQGHQTVGCTLVFSPKQGVIAVFGPQVAAYDFSLPVSVNQAGPPVAPPSASLSRSASSRHIVTPRPRQLATETLSCQVQATVLRAPMEMFPTCLQYHLEMLASSSVAQTQMVELRSLCADAVLWRFGDTTKASAAGGAVDDLFSISPTAGSLQPGQTACLSVTMTPDKLTAGAVLQRSLLLFLEEELGREEKGEEAHWRQPYRELSLRLTLHRPTIAFLPPRLLLTPVPLDTPATGQLTLLASGYPSGTSVTVEAEEVELEDGTTMRPLIVSLPQGCTVPPRSRSQDRSRGETPSDGLGGGCGPLSCLVTFCSAVPLGLSGHVTFTDHLNNRFRVEVCATADNCLLSVWPYLALHRTHQQIVLRSGKATKTPTCVESAQSAQSQTTGESVLQTCHSVDSASRAASSSSSSSTSFAVLSSTSSQTVSESVQEGPSERMCEDVDNQVNRGIPEFPGAEREDGLYYQGVLLAVQKWFSLFGWPRGPHPITLPHTLRRVVAKVQTMGHGSTGSARSYRVSQSRDTRSIYDLMHHLTGKPLPGFAPNQSLSRDTTQRTNQLLSQNAALLTFLKTQGAYLPHIQPQYLLDVQDFNHWCTVQARNDELDMVEYSSADYESLSKRAWTDLLLQTYKVLVLRRVSEGPVSDAQHQELPEQVPWIDPQPLASNVYSTWERRLLTWLNLHYHRTRAAIWDTHSGNGDVPSARWVVNFDLDLADGLVLATVLAAYCPFLIPRHFHRMYTSSSSLEQNLHNNIILTQAFSLLCLDIDVQPTELSDPNPVLMLMLCVHLYERLPQYSPRKTIMLTGSLHHTLTKQVRLRSPSSKPLQYHASILGKEAHLFSLPSGSSITIPAKGGVVDLTVQHTCNFLRPVEAVLLLTCRSTSGPVGATLAFALKTQVTHITPSGVVKCRSPCYQPKLLQLNVTNPFGKEAEFRVILVESAANLLEVNESQESLVQHITSRTSPQNQRHTHLPDGNASQQAENSNMESGEESHHAQCADPDEEERGVNEFHCRVKSIFLPSGHLGSLELHYLPFQLAKRHCSVLLLSPQVGELVYLVKATATLPLPSSLRAQPSPHVVQVRGPTPGKALEAVLRVPLVNEAWERALATWGRQRMSPEELRRRTLTHTLESSTVRARVLVHALNAEQNTSLCLTPSACPRDAELVGPGTSPQEEEVVCVPVRFQAQLAGRYRCQLVLRSWRDVRVYLLEALVHAQDSHAHLSFSTPAHLSVTQEIPLHNVTPQDWTLCCMVSGWGFHGPPTLYVRAGETACYPLSFQPSAQCVVTGKLSLRNECEGTEHTFSLRGVGERPPPLGHVLLHCPVQQVTHAELLVPNYCQHRVTCQVVSDLSIVSGAPSVEIKPGHTVPYTVTLSPWKRGKYTGSVSFVAMETEDNLVSEPTPDVIAVQCPVQSSVSVEVPLSNPCSEPLELAVCLEGEDLSGSERVCVPPGGSLTYQASFVPSRVGNTTASVIFQSELAGEFWYQLDLQADPPPLTTLPQWSCGLGKWTRQSIPLINPTDETLELAVVNSNPQNFTLELDTSCPGKLVVAPHSSTQVPIRFRPSMLGTGSHSAQITFTCPQLKEWCFELSGCGLVPEKEEPVSVSSMIGSHASVIISFANPMQHSALLDITLTDEDPTGTGSSLTVSRHKKVFCVPLRQTHGVRVAAGASLDVPVVFAPDSMELHQAWLLLQLEPLPGPEHSPTATYCHNAGDAMDGQGCGDRVRWVYPIHGLPETPAGPARPRVVQCEVGSRAEERLEVQLTGCATSSQVLTEMGRPSGVNNSGSRVTLDDFLCEMRYHSDAERLVLDGCVAVTLLEGRRAAQTGVVSLGLKLVYAPYRPHRCAAFLAVQCVTGGLWKFPITLVSTEPQVDDVITIHAAGLGKTSSVGFRLTSQTRYPTPFTAGFVPGSGSEFQVCPSSGRLPPAGSVGTLLSVSFTPTMYSKKHRGKLLVQTADMQWTYEVRGTAPAYSPPQLVGSSIGRVSSELHPASVRPRNFVARNLLLPALANSSPFKLRDDQAQIK
ncbi:cilia and flagella-associated protein 47-like [Aplochiton taeniatus]